MQRGMIKRKVPRKRSKFALKIYMSTENHSMEWPGRGQNDRVLHTNKGLPVDIEIDPLRRIKVLKLAYWQDTEEGTKKVLNLLFVS